ncbi:sensor histidine kinase [Agromyces sp. LHK192]|uniref:sensor histidine kinase n=1 Tax=Agromyces sp. LHK192 TaxID=2498704 RepID=UPI000FD90C78|nr:histidine kinase [Agromyces sp. LHK192]
MEFPRGFVARSKAVYAGHPEVYSAAATVGVGAVLLALDLPPIWTSTALTDPASIPDGWRYAILAAGFVVMLGRRRHPMIALTAGTTLFAADLAIGGTLGMLFVFFDLIYSAAFWASARARGILFWLIVAATLASAVLPWALGLGAQLAVLLAIQAFAVLATPYWWASAVRRGRELAASEAARADDAQRLAAVERERAVRAERARMAQDLHDVIAGNLAAIAITSEASLARSAYAARDRAALVAVREASVAGLEQMRSMIVLLRTGDEGRSAPPRLADLDELVAAVEIEVSVVGAPPALPTAVDQAAARIVVESLRNAAKHRPGAAVELSFAVDGDDVVVQVRSSGGRAVRAVGTGHGVPMMRDRAEGVGGTLTAGPVPAVTPAEATGAVPGASTAGGPASVLEDWLVTARLPRRTG